MKTTKTALLKAKTTASTIHGKYIGIPTAIAALPPKQITTVFACFHVPFLSNAHFFPSLYVERYICGAWIAFIVAWLKNHSLFTLFIYFYPLFFPCVSIAIQNMEEMEMEQKTEREERNEWMTKKHEIVHMVSWRKIGSLMTIIIFNMDVWRHCFVASFNSVYHWLKYDPSFHNVGSPECRSHHALSAHFFLY